MTEEIRTRLEEIRAGKIPKGYKQTPSGIIPQDWHDVEMSDVTEEIKECAGNKKYETLSISAGIGFVNQAEKFGREISGAQYAKYIVLHRGDFSYNKGNSNLYPQGCIYRLNDREEAAVPNVFESFRFLSLDGNYYEQLFVSGYLNKQLYSKINHGVRDDGLLNLTGKDFYDCHLPVPPLPEQQKIAEILMQYDKAIALQQCKIEEIKQMKKACLSKMFPGKGETVPEMRFSGFINSWEQRKLGELSEKTFGGGTPSTSNTAFWNGSIPWLQSSDIVDGQLFGVIPRKYISTDGLNKSAAQLVPENSIAIITRVGVGKLAFVPFSYTTSQDFLSLGKLKTEPFFTVYACYKKLQSELNAVQGTSIKGITKEELLAKEIMVPEYAEQKKIGTFFCHLDHLITLHQRELKEMQIFKKFLMQLLMTGIVRVKV